MMLKRLNLINFLSLLPLLLFPVVSDAAASRPQISIVFRYDDYSSRSDTRLEQKIIEVFKKYNICCTFGIIPFVKSKSYLEFEPQEVIPLTPEKVALARHAIKAGVLDAAQHGYSHQTIQTRNWHTELATLDYDTQMYKIAGGKAFLEKVLTTKITTFIPPYNSYDAVTLEVLEKLGFQCLSANLNGETVPAASLKMLPGTCTLGNLKKTVAYARKVVDFRPIICVVFHQYAFTDVETVAEEEDINYKMIFENFSELLSWVSSQEDVRVISIGQLLQENVDLSMERFINNKYYLQLVHLKPAWWPPHYGIYLPAKTAYNTRFRNLLLNYNIPRIRNIAWVCLYYCLILIFIIVATFIIGSLAFALSEIIDKLFKYLSIISSVILISYLFFSFKIQYKYLEIIVGLCGLSLGGWLLFFKKKLG